MGLFSSKKINFGELFPDPPSMTLAGGSDAQLLADVNQLINTFQGRANGTDQFDYLKFLFEPQKAYVDRQYADDMDELYGNLNRRGLLDSGVSGEFERRMSRDKNEKLADLFGQSKRYQREDIDNALANLGELFPRRFEVANIPNQLAYFNAMNKHNALINRNQLTAQQTASRQSGLDRFAPMIGAGVGALFGGSGGAAMGSQMFGGQGFGIPSFNVQSQDRFNYVPWAVPGVAGKSSYGGAMANPFNTSRTRTSLVNQDTPGLSNLFRNNRSYYEGF